MAVGEILRGLPFQPQSPSFWERFHGKRLGDRLLTSIVKIDDEKRQTHFPVKLTAIVLACMVVGIAFPKKYELEGSKIPTSPAPAASQPGDDLWAQRAAVWDKFSHWYEVNYVKKPASI